MVILSNPMLKRSNCFFLQQQLKNPSEHNNVLLIEGARQVGKTTFVNQVLSLFPQTTTVNLEENKIFRSKIDETSSFPEFEKLLELELKFSPKPGSILFIDEAQESKILASYIRSMKEQWKYVFCVLTGSSMTRLFDNKIRIPVGRLTKYKLGPFSFREFLLALDKKVLVDVLEDFTREQTPISPLFHKELLSTLDQYLLVGGLPEVVYKYKNSANYKVVRQNILLLQEEDFIRKELFQKRYLFLDSLRATANHLGFPSSFSHICESTNDAKQIVSVQKAWHLIIELEQRGISSTTKFHPKRYLYDLGIAQDLRNMPFPDLSVLNTKNPILRTSIGGLLENFVLINLEEEQLGQVSLSSWKKNSKEQIEVDFIINEKRPIPLECKASNSVTNRTFSNVRNYLSLINSKVGFVASAAPFAVTKEGDKQLINLPYYLINLSILKQLSEH